MLTLDSESPEISYVGLVLSKDRYISWISQMKTILFYCLTGLDNLKPERVSDHKSIHLRLHTLVSFTSPGTWAIQKVEGMEKLKAGMNQLCANIMGHLVNKGFYPIMQVIIILIVVLLFSVCFYKVFVFVMILDLVLGISSKRIG